MPAGQKCEYSTLVLNHCRQNLVTFLLILFTYSTFSEKGDQLENRDLIFIF